MRLHLSVKENKGFTLAELLVTLFVLIILFTALILTFAGATNKRNMEFDARAIEGVMRDAQQRAIIQEDQAFWGIRFWNVGDPYFVLFKSNAPIFGWLYPAGSLLPEVTFVTRFPLRSNVYFIDPGIDEVKDIVFSKITGIPDPEGIPGAFENRIELSNSIGGPLGEIIAVTNNGTIRN
jgi:type II secretory pathway pseudopilin PulG